jgi:hypothetical protein
MMIMRPPQQGHGRGSTRDSSRGAASDVSGGCEGAGAASSNCTHILSITKWEWNTSEGLNCDPTSVKLTTDTAPSGTEYTARIMARCYPGGPVSAGKLRSFEFRRYKAHLTVKSDEPGDRAVGSQ